jgi:hypothetical protein
MMRFDTKTKQTNIFIWLKTHQINTKEIEKVLLFLYICNRLKGVKSAQKTPK